MLNAVSGQRVGMFFRVIRQNKEVHVRALTLYMPPTPLIPSG